MESGVRHQVFAAWVAMPLGNFLKIQHQISANNSVLHQNSQLILAEINIVTQLCGVVKIRSFLLFFLWISFWNHIVVMIFHFANSDLCLIPFCCTSHDKKWTSALSLRPCHEFFSSMNDNWYSPFIEIDQAHLFFFVRKLAFLFSWWMNKSRI